VLSLYYTEELNMSEIAEVLGITEGRVSQLRTQALGRLRKIFVAEYGAL
jgi:RNA polymerase sigma factor for flagellar operon FliA